VIDHDVVVDLGCLQYLARGRARFGDDLVGVDRFQGVQVALQVAFEVFGVQEHRVLIEVFGEGGFQLLAIHAGFSS
jgi:hypothetical protein